MGSEMCIRDRKGFDLTVTDPADVTGFLRYMLEAGRTERVAG